MRRWLLLSVIAAALASGVLAAPDLKRAQAESNLEKRSGLALDNAAAALRSARESYQKGDNRQVEADVTEIKDSVDLAYTSLVQTGKDPRRSPKWFKHAEFATRDLLRRLESFQQEMDFADRAMLDPVKARVSQVHDDLLLGLMEGKRK